MGAEGRAEGEDLAAAVLRHSTDGLLVFDLDGRIRWADATFCRMVAIPEEDVVGTALGGLLGGAARRRWPDSLERLAAGHPGDTNREMLFETRDGRRVWTLASWGPLPPSPGEQDEQLTWVRVTEYSERRRLLAALADREGHLDTAHELAGLGSLTWRVGSDDVAWSPALAVLLGEDPAGVPRTLSQSLERVLPEGRAQVERDLAGPLVAGTRLAWQLQMARADGAPATVRMLAEVTRAADGSGALEVRATVQDVTTAVATAADADDARSRLLLLLGVAEAANDAAGLADALEAAWSVLRRHTSWRPSAVFVPLDEDIIGGFGEPGLAGLARLATDRGAGADRAGTDEVTIGPIDLSVDQPRAGVLPPPEPALARSAWRSGLVGTAPAAGHASTHTTLAVPVLLDGETCAVVQMVVPEVPVCPATVRLMTRLADLLAAVAQRERDAHRLAEARDEAERASRLKSDFLTTMSHEIRTPMNGVIGLTELLLRTTLDGQQRTLAEALSGTGRSLLSLINDILDLSKIESGHLELDRTETDPRSVVEQAVSVVAGQARAKGLELVLTCAADVPERILGDPLRLGQVVTNLCSNAVKFTDAGEVEVTLRTTTGQDTGPDPVLRVEVRDTGIGIDIGDGDDALFEAFTQGDPSSTRRHDGTGLGLTICRRLVEAMGGRIGLTSAPGRGTTFWFTVGLVPLPAAPASVGARVGPVARGAGRLCGVPVLVVDDNDASRRSLVGHLTAWGAAPQTCAGAAGAREQVARAAAAGAAYQVVLVDRSLPEGDTAALAEELAAAPHAPGLVLLDGTAPEQGEQGHDLAARFHATATKPARRDDLWQALLVALEPTRTTTPLTTPLTTPGALPSGVRVLLAEDNAVNQLVAVGLLESLGCEVEVAVDGEQALARLTPGHDFHVVLMDCLMPRLDGVEATRRLRAAEAAGGAGAPGRVPVLAMTASVLNGERERCLDAGMDDFLTKPVSRADLARALTQWVSRYRLRAADPALPLRVSWPAAPEQVVTTQPDLFYPDEDERPVLDLARVEELRELVKDGISFFDRARESYLSRVDGLQVQLSAAAARDDHEALLGVAHQFSGSSANLGLVRVTDTARALEAAGREQQHADVPRLLEELSAQVVQARRALGSVGRTAESRTGTGPAGRPGPGLPD